MRSIWDLSVTKKQQQDSRLKNECRETLLSAITDGNKQGDHLCGKPGNVREFGSCQGNVRDFTKSPGNVKEKILWGKSCLKLFIVSCIFESVGVLVSHCYQILCGSDACEVVWPRGLGRQVSRSFPCSTSLHIACPKELEAASRSSKTYLAKDGGGRSAPI